MRYTPADGCRSFRDTDRFFSAERTGSSFLSASVAAFRVLNSVKEKEKDKDEEEEEDDRRAGPGPHS